MSMFVPARVTVCEVGLRDGLQSEKTVLSCEQKLALLRGILRSGFSVVEVGSFVSPKAVPQMADTDELFRRIHEEGLPDGVELRALAANPRGVARAAACGCKKVKLNVSASRAHNLANLNCTPAQSIARFAQCAEDAAAANIAVSGSISMPFASPWEREIPIGDVAAIVEAYLAVGVREISLSDASGMAAPTKVHSLCERMRRQYPDVIWWMHFHNTRGAAMANVVAAMDAGMTRFDASFGGFGGCPFVPGAAGNVASEDLLNMLSEMDIDTGVNLDAAIATARMACELAGRPSESYILRAGKSCQCLSAKGAGTIR